MERLISRRAFLRIGTIVGTAVVATAAVEGASAVFGRPGSVGGQGLRDGEGGTPTPTVAPTAAPRLIEVSGSVGGQGLRAGEGGVSTPVVNHTAEPTVTPTVAPSPIQESEVIGHQMELPKPAAWDHVPSVSLVKASSVPSFPKTAAEAATTFGVDGSTRNPSRWERTAEGDGWHLSEAQIGDDTKDALNVNPRGYLAEGFYDTKPGHNPFAFVVVDIDGKIPAQGATFWNERGLDRASKLQKEMATPKWKDEKGNVTDHPVTIIAPNQDQKAEAVSAVPAKYPETADKAASLFGGKPEQWKLNPSGVWNFNSTEEVVITLDGVTADGYNKDGAVVATGSKGKVSVKLLGATIYNIKPEEVQKLIDAVQAKNPGKKVQIVGIQ